MEEIKHKFIYKKEENSSMKTILKPILKTEGKKSKEPLILLLRKSKTCLEKGKNVSFPDKVQMPLHTIHEVEPIIYYVDIPEVKKSKKKGCTCIII